MRCRSAGGGVGRPRQAGVHHPHAHQHPRRQLLPTPRIQTTLRDAVTSDLDAIAVTIWLLTLTGDNPGTNLGEATVAHPGRSGAATRHANSSLMRSDPAQRLWWVSSLVGVVAVAAYFLIIPVGWPRDIAYDVFSIASVCVVVLATRWHKPTRAAPWYWFAAGLTCSVLGDLIYSYYMYVLDAEPFPSPADAGYLASYVFLSIGLVQLARRRSGGWDLTGLVDAGIVSIGLTLLSWAFLMRPIAMDGSTELLPRLIGLSYPAADVLLLILIVRLLVANGIRNTSYRLLVTAVVLQLASDVVYAVQTSTSGYAGGWVDAGWLISFVAWAAAALHPTMRRMGETSHTGGLTLRGRRLALLAAASLLAPGLLLWQGMRHGSVVDWLAIALAGIAVVALVLLRVSGLVAQLHRQSARMSDLAMRDDLTGLSNRRDLIRRLQQELDGAPGPQVHLVVIGLDGFRDVNDRYGQVAGDQLLVAIAGRLAAHVRPVDVVARLGGDEFTIMAPETASHHIDQLVGRINAELRQPIVVDDYHLLVEASVGIADGAGTTDALEVLRRADVALNAAKRGGTHGSVRFDRHLDEITSEAARLGADLRQAMDTGQLDLHYQPIVRLEDGAITAVETLLRWHHPTRGAVSPAQFIPIAERNGLIIDLGTWILREACTQMQQWREHLGHQAPTRISVNVSARQLHQPGFAATVATALSDTGLPADALVIEVTETAAFEGRHALLELARIQQLGVKVALDDFGTGHSSLSLLQTCPADIVKVDKSFVDEISSLESHPVIVAALVRLCAELQLTAVAEGVETIDQAQHLYRLGYRHAQGFLFARPMTATQLSNHIAGSTPSSENPHLAATAADPVTLDAVLT
jgi:diguanylate cyclase (GGDEF)-like protein